MSEGLLSGEGAAPAEGGENVGGDVAASTSQAKLFADIYGESGFNESAFEGLGDDLKSVPSFFKKYDSPESAMKGLANLQWMVSQKGFTKPPEDAPAHVKDEFSKRLRELNGAPPDPTAYIPKPAELPEGVTFDEGLAKQVSDIAWKYSLPKAAVDELVALDMQRQAAMGSNLEQQTQAQLSEQQNALKQQYGNELPVALEKATRAAKTLGLDPESPVFRYADAVSAMVKVAELLSEDKLVSGESTDPKGVNDYQKAMDIISNPSNPLYEAFHNPEHPQHKLALETRSRFNASYTAKQAKMAGIS